MSQAIDDVALQVARAVAELQDSSVRAEMEQRLAFLIESVDIEDGEDDNNDQNDPGDDPGEETDSTWIFTPQRQWLPW